jgi:hypothetical protein
LSLPERIAKRWSIAIIGLLTVPVVDGCTGPVTCSNFFRALTVRVWYGTTRHNPLVDSRLRASYVKQINCLVLVSSLEHARETVIVISVGASGHDNYISIPVIVIYYTVS